MAIYVPDNTFNAFGVVKFRIVSDQIQSMWLFVLKPDGLLLSLFGSCLFSLALMIRFAPLQLQRVNRALGEARKSYSLGEAKKAATAEQRLEQNTQK